MAASLTSATYSPLHERHEPTSHQRNISETSSNPSSLNGGSISSKKQGSSVDDNLIAPFSPSTFVDSLWSGRSRSSQEKPNVTFREREIGNSGDESPLPKGAKGSSHGTWLLEIICTLTSACALAAIVGVLSHYDGHALPKWPKEITLNTVIALLTATANASIVAPLSSGLSQLKWTHFKGKRQPLVDIETFDDASRGVYGSVKLLFFGRGGIVGSLGACAVILALALGPFAQQIVAYRSRFVNSSSPASIMTASNYTGFLPGNNSEKNSFVPYLPMKASVYNGMFSAYDPSKALAVDCPTGNCTWPQYDTLAVCSSCVSMTEYLSRSCKLCTLKLPSGASLNPNTSVFSMTTEMPDPSGSMPYTDIMRLTFMGTEAQDGTAGATDKASAPWAIQCSFQYCVQSLESSVRNGVLIENITSTYTNATVLDITSDLDAGNPVPALITSSSNITFTVGMGFILGIQQWFSTLFRDATASRSSPSPSASNTSDPSSNIVVNLTVGASSGETYFSTDIVQSFYWYYYKYPSGLSMLTTSLAQSMTTQFRSGDGAIPILGVAQIEESYVHIRWAWLTLPVGVVLATAIFLGAAIVNSRRRGMEVWKSSALATLFQGEALGGKAKRRWVRGGAKGLRGYNVCLEEGGEKGEIGRGLVGV